MAQERKIVPNLYTSGGEFVIKSKQHHGSAEEYIGSFHYDIDADKYYTFATPEVGLAASEELMPLDVNARDENGYLIAPYNTEKNYRLKLSRKKYEDVKEVIDNTITELAPPEILSPELTIPERIELLKAEFSDLKEHISDEDLDFLIRESLLESSQILIRGNTDEVMLSYFDIAHFGIQLKGTLSDDENGNPKGPHVKIEANRTDIWEGDVNHTDLRWYNFMVPVSQDQEGQEIAVTFNDDKNDDTGDRNLTIGLIKNKPITYHAYAENPDIYDENTLLIPEVTSSQKDAWGNNLIVPAVTYDSSSTSAKYNGYYDNVYYIENDTDKSTEPLYKKYNPNGDDVGATDPNNALAGSSVLLYNEDGDALLNKYPEDSVTYPGKFKSGMPWNSQVKMLIPNDWFLSEYPSQPVEFTTDDFQIGTIKQTKIDLIECMTKEELQISSIDILKQKLNEENEILIDRAEDAEAVSGSQAIEIKQMRDSINMMSEPFLALYDGEDTGHNMAYNSRFKREVSRDGKKVWRTDNRPEYWYLSNSYKDKNPDQMPLALGEWYDFGGPPSEISGYPQSDKGIMRLHYFPPGGVLSEEGWPNETQRIGFRMKANSYRGWPKVRLKDVKRGKSQTKSVNSYDWKIYWFDVALPSVGVANKTIELHLAFINNRMKRGPWYRRGKYNNKHGKDRDVWISHIVRADGQMYATNKGHNSAMTTIRMKNDSGQSLTTAHSNPDKKWHTAELTDVNNKDFYGWTGTDLMVPNGGKLDGNAGIRFTFPANSEHIFVKGEAGSPPPNTYAAIYCGGRGYSDNDDNGFDGMNDQRGIFVLPYYRYQLKFCARKAESSKTIEYNGAQSHSPASNTRFGVFVGDRRNGWRGSDNPYPGTEGYEWFESEEFDLNADHTWQDYELEFIPVPGPQGGAKVYFGFYLHKGIQGEKNIIEFSECRIVGPLDDDAY